MLLAALLASADPDACARLLSNAIDAERAVEAGVDAIATDPDADVGIADAGRRLSAALSDAEKQRCAWVERSERGLRIRPGARPQS